MRLFFHCSLMLYFLTALACVKKFKSESLPQNLIIFGSGGGIAGTERRFILLQNGQLFEQRGFETPREQPSIKKKTAKALWRQAQALELNSYANLKPGNTYHFFEIHNGGQPMRTAWSPQQEDLPQAVKQYYELLMRTVSTLQQNQ